MNQVLRLNTNKECVFVYRFDILKFNIQLSKKISNIPNMPLKFRQSSYYEDEKIRDLVFKGYTIPYLVDIDKNVIIILDIFKWSYKKQIK